MLAITLGFLYNPGVSTAAALYAAAFPFAGKPASENGYCAAGGKSPHLCKEGGFFVKLLGKIEELSLFLAL